MAFSRFLRRAASSTVPLLLRSFSASASTSRPLSLISAQSMILRHRWAFSSSFSSSSSSAMAKAPTDASLLRVIESEIKCAEECDDHEHVDEVPEGFPFEIEDEKGMNIIRLKRIYQGKEKIEVTVSMPSLVTGEEPEGEDEDEDGEGEGANSQAQSHIPITVRVSKDGGAPALEFACTAYPDEVMIDSMSVIESRGGEEEDDLLNYEGPDFNDLDENLQKAFHKYLELRGITPLNTNFLHEYMINKDSHEYLLWLRNLKAFVQK
ncbi:Mitochondrial glycoprotein [Carex littledalei]|uniref:Mitochondrial glycoprotein n=1 Tax=Carex littledalei TaxID=544730 RepID=A0A833QYW5_9POAL|nr:Mitochondrial glycoprotein [Carex littledalei]